jgi:tRNA threonylcarbamoyladenosine biosynthesis protein TsaE
MIHTTQSVEETLAYASDFARSLKGGEAIALTGSLGAGKTTFVQGLAQGLNIEPKYYVNSPTFTLMNEYHSTTGQRFIHLDLYRLHSYEEFVDLGVEEPQDESSIMVVEWADKFSELKDFFDFWIHLTHQDENSRILSITS